MKFAARRLRDHTAVPAAVHLAPLRRSTSSPHFGGRPGEGLHLLRVRPIIISNGSVGHVRRNAASMWAAFCRRCSSWNGGEVAMRTRPAAAPASRSRVTKWRGCLVPRHRSCGFPAVSCPAPRAGHRAAVAESRLGEHARLPPVADPQRRQRDVGPRQEDERWRSEVGR